MKDLLGGTIKEMMETEMDDYLGYQKSERSDSDNYRNAYKQKRVQSSYGDFQIDVPQDRKSTFEPKVVQKRQKNISGIDQKIISMYAKGLNTSQISSMIEDIYGFEASEGFVSDVTDKILPQIEDWQNRPPDEVYPIVFIDAVHFLFETKKLSGSSPHMWFWESAMMVSRKCLAYTSEKTKAASIG